MGGTGAAAIPSRQATMSVSLAHTASRIFSLSLSSTNDGAHARLRLFTYTGLYYHPAEDVFTEPNQSKLYLTSH